MSLDHLENFLETFEKKVLHFFGQILRFFEVKNFENVDFHEFSNFELKNVFLSFFLSFLDYYKQLKGFMNIL